MNKEITIRELTEKRKNLENQINNLVFAFLSETGVRIENVTVEVKTTSTLNGVLTCEVGSKVDINL